MFFNGWRATCKIKIDRNNSRFAMYVHLVPGAFVRHPSHPEWGLGQVQSVIGNRVTVNFENAGKLLIIADAVTLVEVENGSEDGRS